MGFAKSQKKSQFRRWLFFLNRTPAATSTSFYFSKDNVAASFRLQCPFSWCRAEVTLSFWVVPGLLLAQCHTGREAISCSECTHILTEPRSRLLMMAHTAPGQGLLGLSKQILGCDHTFSAWHVYSGTPKKWVAFTKAIPLPILRSSLTCR